MAAKRIQSKLFAKQPTPAASGTTTPRKEDDVPSPLQVVRDAFSSESAPNAIQKEGTSLKVRPAFGPRSLGLARLDWGAREEGSARSATGWGRWIGQSAGEGQPNRPTSRPLGPGRTSEADRQLDGRPLSRSQIDIPKPPTDLPGSQKPREKEQCVPDGSPLLASPAPRRDAPPAVC